MTRDEHLLTIAGEECAEITQRCSKALRFGQDEIRQQYTRLTDDDTVVDGFPGIWRATSGAGQAGSLKTHKSMPITPRYVLVCDQIRQENNGKFIVLGLYTPDIVVGAVPVGLPSLAFLAVFDTTEAGMLNFSFQLSHAGQVLAGGSGGAQAVRPGIVVLPFNLGPVQLMSAGTYTFSLQVVGSPEPITASFDVQLSLPAHAVPTPTVGRVQ